MIGDTTVEEMFETFGNVSNAKELLYDWGGINKWLFVQVNGIRGHLYDSAMQVLSALGDRHHFFYWLAGLAGFAAFTALVRIVRRRGGTKNYLIGWIGVFAVLGAGFAVNTAVVHVAKNYFSYARPYIALARDEAYESVKVNLLEPSKDAEDDYRSFPSGHVAFVTLLVMALWPMLPVNARWLGILFIFAEAWSRMALGRHFPADAVGAILITVPLTFMVQSFIYGVLRRLGLNC